LKLSHASATDNKAVATGPPVHLHRYLKTYSFMMINCNVTVMHDESAVGLVEAY